MSSTTGTRPALDPPSGQAPPGPPAGQEQGATLGLASATGLVVTHNPVAAAFSRRNSRWPASRDRVPGGSSRVDARLAGTHARPFRIRRHHLDVAKVTSASPGSIRHRKA
jgi:hypothetical protein